MIQFTATMHRFAANGEKTGWTYIDVPAELASKLLPDNKKAFRVKGKLDSYAFAGISLLPMGEGDFIMALNATIRKGLKKSAGATVKVQIEIDNYEKPLSADFMECMEEESKALETFQALAKSHQKYFSNWIESAKTDTTKAKRIAQAIKALSMGFGFSEMMKMNRKE
jgi:hypothetical protein